MTVFANAYTPLRLPESMGRLDIGPYMRGLREHYGLSQQDVSERLHIRLRYVKAIEENQLAVMPGKVYAKGYVHTYAEFLGLDADQVVELCFGPELARETQAHFIPEPARPHARVAPHWLWLGGAALIALAFYGALRGPSSGKEETPAPGQSEEVPESMLASMRTALMPTAQNIDCLDERSALACFYAARLTQRWVVPPSPPSTAPLAPDMAPEEE